MKNKYFYSKILLFGEYGIIKNSSGLSIPFKKFNGTLKLNDKPNAKVEASNLEIQKFFEYIKANTNYLGRFNLQSLKEDISNGLYFDSDIPKGFGVGSSGALVAAIYDKYCDSDTDDLYELKKTFSTMESYFHGNSSGLDPLVSFFNNPIFISEGVVELLADIKFLNSKIYLIDSKYSSSTKEMIELFNTTSLLQLSISGASIITASEYSQVRFPVHPGSFSSWAHKKKLFGNSSGFIIERFPVWYKSKLIKPTENFKLGIFAATGGIALIYLINFIMVNLH